MKKLDPDLIGIVQIIVAIFLAAIAILLIQNAIAFALFWLAHLAP